MKKNINEIELQNIIAESIKKCIAENCEEEGFLGGLFDKKQRALKMYSDYRNMLTQLNQIKVGLNAKAANAYGTNKRNAYKAALQYGQNGYGKTTPQPQPQVNEDIDETLGRGIQSVVNNTVNNLKTKPIAQLFKGTTNAYNRGDAAGDANNYKDLWNKANAQLQSFKQFCAANNINPQEIVATYDRNERHDVLHGNMDRIKGIHATQNSIINGQESGANNARPLGNGGVSFGNQRQGLRNMAKDVNKSVFHTLSEGIAENDIDFGEIADIFESCGCSIIGTQDVRSEKSGKEGVRIDFDGENEEQLILQLGDLVGAENIIQSSGQYIHAPEITRKSLIITY